MWQNYQFFVRTGTQLGAGTDAKVTVKLIGEKDCSEPTRLERSR